MHFEMVTIRKDGIRDCFASLEMPLLPEFFIIMLAQWENTWHRCIFNSFPFNKIEHDLPKGAHYFTSKYRLEKNERKTGVCIGEYFLAYICDAH